MIQPSPHPATPDQDIPCALPQFPEGEEPGLDAQLRIALTEPGVGAEQLARGRRLLDRLERPVQVLVLGLAHSGKSAVVDMLLGQRVLGDVQDLAMVELVHAATPEARFEDAAGAGTTLPGLLGEYEVPAGSVSGRQMLPHPMLKSMQITEITLAGAIAQQQAILRHAVEYGDVILWCSPEFSAAEQSLWNQVPERKRDSGFLVLTSADQLIMRGNLQHSVGRLAPIVQDAFLGLYPVAALQGLQARAAEAETGRQLWRASGGQRLAEDLRRRVAQGRAATRDQVEALLWQLSLSAPGAASSGQATSRTAAPQVDAAPKTPSRMENAQIQSPARTKDAGTENASEEAGQTVLAQALAQLQNQAETMLTDAGGEPKSTAVLNQCLLAVHEMAETLMQAPEAGRAVGAAREACQDGEEMLMLLQLEQDEDAAVDAVTLLLQLKRELTDPAAPAVQQEGTL